MSIIADWHPLGRLFYRKQDIYTVDWANKIDLRKFHVAAASSGGPIAFIRDDTKFKTSGSNQAVIYIFSCSGREISAKPWNSGRLLKMGWSESQDLLCIQDDGTVLFYNVFGEPQQSKTFTMGTEAKETKVIDTKVFHGAYGTGIVVLTGSYRFFLVNNIDSPRVRKLAEIQGLRAPPSSWEVFMQEQKSKVLVAKDSDIYLIDDEGNSQLQKPEESHEVSSCIEMVTSYSNKHLALFFSSGILWLGSTSLEKCFCEFDTKKPTRPQHLVWCSEGAIVGVWSDLMLIVGLEGDCIRYVYDSPVYLVPEPDCLRIITHTAHEILEKVPDATLDIFQIGSMKPGAMLLEAWKAFEGQSTHAHDYITSIKADSELQLAVDQCITAASQEWDVPNQRKLLRAAQFGKLMLANYNPDYFTQTCQRLRVLNGLRDPLIGIPLTFAQLDLLTYPVLIDRLVLHREFFLALRIADFLRLSELDGHNRILFHWACYKVDQNMPQDEIAASIIDKLGESGGISYSAIASRAFDKNKKDLAVKLLSMEPRIKDVVKQLIHMGFPQAALPKAIESGDPELVYMVLDRLQVVWGSNFLIEVRKYPMAHALHLQNWRRENNTKKLQDILKQEDKYAEQARCAIQEAYSTASFEERLAALKSAQTCFANSKLDWAAKQTEEQVALFKRQQTLERELNRSGTYVDKSIHETISQLIMDNQLKRADELQREFKVPDKMYWWIKVQALAASGDWAELSRFSGHTKKPPIGFESFVEVCMKYDKKVEAEKYLKLVTPEHRAKALIKMGMLEEAVESAFEQKSEENLNLILSRCATSNKPLAERINTLKKQLASKQ